MTKSKTWELTWRSHDPCEFGYSIGRIESDDYSWLADRANGLKERGCSHIRIEKISDLYSPNRLPADWRWEGAVAGPDGYNGRAYVANVAVDTVGQLWVFTKHGRYRIHRSEFERRLISTEHLQGLPLHLDPSES